MGSAAKYHVHRTESFVEHQRITRKGVSVSHTPIKYLALADVSRYNGKKLREIRAERGVGRPR